MSNLMEMDGLPRGYMELGDGFHVVRFVYKTIKRRCDTWEDAYECRRRLMKDINNIAISKDIEITILWRCRITIQEVSGAVELYCRFETSPPMPEDFWKKWQVKEGEEAPQWSP